MTASGRGRSSGKAEKERRPTVAQARAAAQAADSQQRAGREAALAARFAGATPGRSLVVADVAVTIVVTILTASALGSYSTFATAAAAVDLVVFSVGLVLFAAALWLGAQRSREAEMDVAGWFFLSRIAPRQVQRTMLGSLAVQVVIGIGGALASHGAAVTAGDRASRLAFGTLVPIFGLALCGLWSARHGAFPARRAEAPPVRRKR